MADIRCPMCGKLNPEDREICQFCQARLKPLRMSSSDPLRPNDPEPFGLGGGKSSPGKPQRSEEDVPDWLSNLRSSESEDEPGGGTPAFDFGTSEDAENFDPAAWLAGLRSQPSEPAEQESSRWGAAPDPGGSDWLNSLRGGSSESSTEETPEEEESAPMGGDLPDWLSGSKSRSSSSSAGEEEPESLSPSSADWQAGAPSEPEKMPWELPAADEPAPSSTGEAYDWLANFGQEPPEQPAEKPDELPDWLQSQDAASSEPTWLMEPSGPEAAKSDDLPDWLKQKTEPDSASGAQSFDLEPADPGETPPAAQDETPAEMPAWLTDFALQNEPAQPGALSFDAEEKATPEPASPSDWDAFLAEPKAEAEAPTAGEAVAPSEDLDWLAELGEGTPQPGEPAGGTSVSPFAFDETDNEADLEPLYDAQIPDWLADISTQSSEPADAASAGSGRAPAAVSGSENETGLERSDLPSWLEAIRPVESAIPETPAFVEGEDQLMGIGPLAGLKGVLPAEPDITRIKKPGSYTVKLQVSEAQARHASLLGELIQAEGEPRAIPARARVTPQHVLRVLVAVVLTLAVLWPLITGTPSVSLPDPLPAGWAVNEIIGSLETDAPVLVAFDYDPGFAGEMDATASAVLDHLMIEGAYLTFVSTTPNGPVQAERVVQAVNQRGGHTYGTEFQYSNLGFIPGGATGLVSFASNPRGVMPLVLGGASPWSKPQLGDVQSLADFKLLVVITEDPDRARAWIEQVQPSLGETPLVMAVSAQAEPLIRPYLDGSPQQVQGLISGVAGGAAYETSNGRPGLASSYWTAFSLAVWAAIGLIGLGALINAGMVLFSKNRADAERDEMV